MDYLLLIHRPRRDGRLSWPRWLAHTLPTKWSHVNYWSGIDQGKSARDRRPDHWATPPIKSIASILPVFFEYVRPRRVPWSAGTYACRLGCRRNILQIPPRRAVSDALRTQNTELASSHNMNMKLFNHNNNSADDYMQLNSCGRLIVRPAKLALKTIQ